MTPLYSLDWQETRVMEHKYLVPRGSPFRFAHSTVQVTHLWVAVPGPYHWTSRKHGS